MSNLPATISNQIAVIRSEPPAKFDDYLYSEQALQISVATKEQRKPTTDYICEQLQGLVNSVKTKDRLSPPEIIEIALELANRYWYWKLQDIALFCRRAKFGDYGKVYDRLDAMTILEMAVKFDQQRDKFCAQTQIRNRKPIEIELIEEVTPEQIQELTEKVKSTEKKYKGGIAQMLRDKFGTDDR